MGGGRLRACGWWAGGGVGMGVMMILLLFLQKQNL